VDDRDRSVEADPFPSEEEREGESDGLGPTQDGDPFALDRKSVVPSDLDRGESDGRDLHGHLSHQATQIRGADAINVLRGSKRRDRAIEIERRGKGVLKKDRMDARVSVESGQTLDEFVGTVPSMEGLIAEGDAERGGGFLLTLQVVAKRTVHASMDARKAWGNTPGR
jgi:hypothetical protein